MENYFSYATSFKNLKLFINNKELNKKQKNVYLKLVYEVIYFNKYLFLIALLKSPVNILKYLLKHQSEDIRDLERQQIEYHNNRFLKYHANVKEIKIEDINRKITIKVSNAKIIPIIFISYYESIMTNQYNVSSEKIKNKIVIDVGSNLGEFAIYCARLGAKRVYAFEPVTETFKILKKQIKINNLKGRVIPIKMALGNKNETSKINFNMLGDLRANIDGSGSKSEAIKIIRLDYFCKKEEINKVDFIKIDVEGYEENVLKGAIKIIKRDKPILSFSAYHKPEDKKVLPALVLKLRSDYKIKLLKRAEEDFYCE